MSANEIDDSDEHQTMFWEAAPLHAPFRTLFVGDKHQMALFRPRTGLYQTT